ncbi:putative tRNA adenylyltransferase [Catonella morbi ATCC 51271]|uniref:Putative tRNA adenylyltransferase n=1 Tax=Catonella morbi ATCC 51271 TaxID=592026 RepID=V2XLS1_9FIRM|nr:CCA tRNA nucleotidyltransferase [Catonella morbi]ESL03094.1 putative tRNA adenylyltransferase [Catonella morbi ATCC 51271]
MHIKLPAKVKYIISRLEKNGYEAYAVGGCVRDSILDRIPEDWDITTSAKPEEVKKLFPATIDTGLQHGTVTVVIEKEGYEVTTFRLDGDYSDGRHPDRVAFTSSLTEDLKRRDFTINAMAYSEITGLIDRFDGEKDLEDGIIRAVGDAEERFSEDALRMLRAIRFAGQLNFDIAEKTFDAIKKLSPNISKVSVERIAKELEKLLLSGNPEYIGLVYEAGIFEVIAPEIAALFDKGEIYNSIKAVSCTSYPEKKELYQIRTALFLERLGADSAAKLLKRFKLDNDTINTVKKLIGLLQREVEASALEMRRTVKEAGHKIMPLLFEARRAKALTDSSKLYENLLVRGECTDIAGLKVNGKDLMEAGIPKGIMIGQTLERLLELVIENPELNTREGLLSEVKNNEE